MDFDSDDELDSHLITEAVKGANEMTEDQLQIDLLNGAGVVRYPGAATSDSNLTGEGTATVVTYDMLVKLGITLNDNLAPLQTKQCWFSDDRYSYHSWCSCSVHWF